MSAAPNSSSVEADVLRCGYSFGFFDNSDIEHWADRQIDATECPSSELLDLSMIGKTHPIDVMRLLRSFGAGIATVSINAQIGFIGLLRAKKMMAIQDAIRALWALVHEQGTTQEQRSEIYYLDDGYELAVEGTYGTLDGIEQDLDAFVSPYAIRLANEFPHLIPSAK